MNDQSPAVDFDVVIVGGGAAGLTTAIFALQRSPGGRLAVLDGARKPGAKILISGGSRCNVTNVAVSESDFNGGRPSVIRRVLRALPVPETVAFFQRLGVTLHQEPHGKLFPDSERSRDVLEALLGGLTRLGGVLLTEHRVLDLRWEQDRFQVATSRGVMTAGAVVLATGGLSLPKTGSDGAGYELARRFGHSIVPTTPALAPLLLDAGADGGVHTDLAGVSHEARLEVRMDEAVSARVCGALLWTHFGVSGPAVLDASRHWLRGALEARRPRITASLMPAETFETLEARWLTLTGQQPRLTLQTALATVLPASVAGAVLRALALGPTSTLACLPRPDRRRLVRRLLEWPLPVLDSRGYNYAEATAGGVDLREVDPSTMESRRRAGLYLVGEVLDVDGRIGGFNFQWAWATARVAGGALGESLIRRLAIDD